MKIHTFILTNIFLWALFIPDIAFARHPNEPMTSAMTADGRYVYLRQSDLRESNAEQQPEYVYRNAILSSKTLARKSPSLQWKPWEEVADDLYAMYETEVQKGGQDHARILSIVETFEDSILKVRRYAAQKSASMSRRRSTDTNGVRDDENKSNNNSNNNTDLASDAALSKLYAAYAKVMATLDDSLCRVWSAKENRLFEVSRTTPKTTSPDSTPCLKNAERSTKTAMQLDRNNEEAVEIFSVIMLGNSTTDYYEYQSGDGHYLKKVEQQEGRRPTSLYI